MQYEVNVHELTHCSLNMCIIVLHVVKATLKTMSVALKPTIPNNSFFKDSYGSIKFLF